MLCPTLPTGRVPRLAVAIAALVGVACGAPAPREAAGPEPLHIATSVAPITNIVANVAGDRARITGIVPEGVNSHTFEPAPSTAELLAGADVVFLNGLGLEEPMRVLAEANLAEGAELVLLGDRVLDPSEYIFDASFPEAEGKPNPHVWTDPSYVVRYARAVVDVLEEHDPAGAEVYRRNLEEFASLYAAFEDASRTAFATIPPGSRKLLTYHDSFPYFARSFEGWQVIGAVQVADFSDPSPRMVAGLIEQIRAERVPAIFGSEVFPSDVLEQIAAETDAVYVPELRDDDLPGEPGDPEHSLLGLLRFDFVTITRALGGDPSALEAFDVVNVAPDRAEYPQ